MYTPRYLEDVILKIHRSFKVLYLGGPRQVGKTTLLLHLAKSLEMNYISLDDLAARKLAKEDPEFFLQKNPPPLFIDEVQYAPQLFPLIKMRVDQTQKKGQYWLTGSQQFALMLNVKESLAGRVGIVYLPGFSLAELKKRPKTKWPFHRALPLQKNKDFIPLSAPELFKQIFRGFFPALHARPAPPLETFYNSYIQTYLDRDLRDIFQVAKISEFHKFLQLCAARTGQALNLSELARDAAISVHAAKEWIGILEAGMQIYLLPPYYENISKRLIKAPKLYFLDTGLASYLTQWKTPETLMNGAMAGAMFETFAVSEIIKSYLARGQQPPLYYFRDKEGHEVDILIEREGILYPIEIKMASVIHGDDLRGIQYLRQKWPSVGPGTLVCLYSRNTAWDRENALFPASFIS